MSDITLQRWHFAAQPYMRMHRPMDAHGSSVCIFKDALQPTLVLVVTGFGSAHGSSLWPCVDVQEFDS